jgi:hypothetical protein
MRYLLGVWVTLGLAGAAYAGAPDLRDGPAPTRAERVALAAGVAIHVAALFEACRAGQRWYRPFAMVAGYAAVVAVWLGDGFDPHSDVWTLSAIAGGVWAVGAVLASPVRSHGGWAAVVVVAAGAFALTAVTDTSRGGFLGSEFWAGAAVLLLWVGGLAFVTIRAIRGRGSRAEPVAAPDPAN